MWTCDDQIRFANLFDGQNANRAPDLFMASANHSNSNTYSNAKWEIQIRIQRDGINLKLPKRRYGPPAARVYWQIYNHSFVTVLPPPPLAHSPAAGKLPSHSSGTDKRICRSNQKDFDCNFCFIGIFFGAMEWIGFNHLWPEKIEFPNQFMNYECILTTGMGTLMGYTRASVPAPCLWTIYWASACVCWCAMALFLSSNSFPLFSHVIAIISNWKMKASLVFLLFHVVYRIGLWYIACHRYVMPSGLMHANCVVRCVLRLAICNANKKSIKTWFP